MDGVAIDFETANGQANSACQVAAVVICDSEIVSEHSWLIRPPRNYFSPRNIAVHGIRPTDVCEAPTMEQVWCELSQIIDGQVVIAHNARFDVGVLVASLAAYDVACPNFEFTCTRLLARCAWPGRTGYGLKPIGEWLGIQFRHHDALEDARCCGLIATEVAQQSQQHELADLENYLQITRGSFRNSRIASPRRKGTRAGQTRDRSGLVDRWGFPQSGSKPGGVDAQAIIAASDAQQPLCGKRIVLLGPLRGLNIAESEALIVKLGGTCSRQIDAQVHYVVACGASLGEATQLAADSAGSGSSGNRIASGGIRVLSERQFRALLPGGKAQRFG